MLSQQRITVSMLSRHRKRYVVHDYIATGQRLVHSDMKNSIAFACPSDSRNDDMGFQRYDYIDAAIDAETESRRTRQAESDHYFSFAVMRCHRW